MKILKVGDPVPDFSLEDQNGNQVRLSDFQGKSNVVLYFYPKDDTPGCTIEAKCFRDNYEVFTGLGAEVIGISSDSAADHRKFSGRHHLPFILLSDPEGTVRELYRVKKSFFVLPGRVTFVIDKKGILRYRFSSQLEFSRHVSEALKVLETLA